jgi:fructokinase
VIALTLSVERVVFGGGVMSDGTLLPLIRAATGKHLNGYLEPLRDPRRLADYICAPALGDRAGICGALLLARMAGDSEAGDPR